MRKEELAFGNMGEAAGNYLALVHVGSMIWRASKMGTEKLWPEREERAGKRSFKQSMWNEVIVQQTEGRRAVPAGVCLEAPASNDEDGWQSVQVWSPTKAMLLPEPGWLAPGRAPGVCFFSRDPSTNVQSKRMAHSQCSKDICWRNDQTGTPEWYSL